jgi:hypothetical protein
MISVAICKPFLIFTIRHNDFSNGKSKFECQMLNYTLGTIPTNFRYETRIGALLLSTQF